MENLPAKVIQEIKRLRSTPDQFGKPTNEHIIKLVAVLVCYGFKINLARGGDSRLKLEPLIDIESADAPKLLKQMQGGAHNGPEFAENRKLLWQANHKEAARLYDLLTEFYTARPLVYSLILVVEKRGPGYGRLAAQSAAYAHDLNGEEYAKWLEAVWAELDAFANFLIGKL